MAKIIGWKDGQKHYCPCNGRCHTEKNPCSLGCVSHHHLIEIENKSETKKADQIG